MKNRPGVEGDDLLLMQQGFGGIEGWGLVPSIAMHIGIWRHLFNEPAFPIGYQVF
jgi:hypothetical protein